MDSGSKVILSSSKEIQSFTKGTGEDRTLDWYLEKIMSSMEKSLMSEVENNKPRLKLVLQLKNQCLYKFYYKKASKKLNEFMAKFYVLKV